ncbi:uncharacterized protein LOC113296905 [Papaver somniferum]|uniref:uncharacterized protein LOC113296905 n=1 Tax=Papaver somniferum TaxID=3469 RepID=UPI000E702208|nr:uncharacterized protein LOC113296905 [Papaver somniferum]
MNVSVVCKRMKSNTITLYRSYQKKGKWNYIDLRGEIIVTTISKIRVFSLFIENSDHKPPSDFGIGKQNSLCLTVPNSEGGGAPAPETIPPCLFEQDEEWNSGSTQD